MGDTAVAAVIRGQTEERSADGGLERTKCILGTVLDSMRPSMGSHLERQAPPEELRDLFVRAAC